MKQKRVYEFQCMALPPLRLVIGDIPNPDPDKRNRSSQLMPIQTAKLKARSSASLHHLEED